MVFCLTSSDSALNQLSPPVSCEPWCAGNPTLSFGRSCTRRSLESPRERGLPHPGDRGNHHRRGDRRGFAAGYSPDAIETFLTSLARAAPFVRTSGDGPSMMGPAGAKRR
jgi:hypothetical protein